MPGGVWGAAWGAVWGDVARGGLADRGRGDQDGDRGDATLGWWVGERPGVVVVVVLVPGDRNSARKSATGTGLALNGARGWGAHTKPSPTRGGVRAVEDAAAAGAGDAAPAPAAAAWDEDTGSTSAASDALRDGFRRPPSCRRRRTASPLAIAVATKAGTTTVRECGCGCGCGWRVCA